ncbi:hypothetical protein Salat_1029600 [Sesamum alatum]|uniref:Uncharacterized protein n=1 Tax=Sesamum alatum TaxID=300844 RepID=A0AAE1YLR2_9LAMI|nr:hypothetical protein Salat_1029600 [Sesamum alatum]
MAMSGILSRSLSRASLRPPTPLLSHHRHRSNKTHHAQFMELEVDQASSSQPDSPEAAAEVVALGVKKLEDAIHSMIVRRAAPDWLPFLPGYSYWVPPRGSLRGSGHPASSMVEFVGKLASSRVARKRSLALDWLLDDEDMASESAKDWPSSVFCVEVTPPIEPAPVVEVEVNTQDCEDQPEDTSNSRMRKDDDNFH